MDVKNNEVTSTRHILSFGNLSPDDFQRLCYWMVERSADFEDAQHYGMTADKKRDVIAYKVNKPLKREQWYFNCKRYKEISFACFRDELDAMKKHSNVDKDYKPDVIVFVTGCPVSTKCKDKVRNYAKKVLFERVLFWTNIELDEKVKADPNILNEFFSGGISTEQFEERVAEKVDMRIAARFKQAGQLSEGDALKVDEVNKEIDETVRCIHANRIEEAKSRLYVVSGKIRDKEKKYTSELARVYNNLGVCYNRPKEEGGNFEKAEEFFARATEVDPDFLKAKVNVATVYLNKGGKENYKKAYDIAVKLWDKSDKKEPMFLEVLIWSIYHYQGLKEAVKYYEESEEARSLVSGHAELLSLMAWLYLEGRDFKTAQELAESALDSAPSSPQILHLKAKILMGRSQEENIIPSFFEVVPKFRDYKDIEIALGLLHQALEALKIESNRYLEQQIKIDILLSSLWLRRANEAKYRDIREKIDVARLKPQQKHQLRIQDFAGELQARNFEAAHRIIVNSSDWAKTDYREKMRLAHVFFLQGAARQSNDILKQLETVADRKRDVQFWLDVSLNEVLLDNKYLAIHAVQKAKDFAEGTDMQKTTLSHLNALMMRYASTGEVDRFMEGIFDYDKRYPEDKIVTPVRAINAEGKPTDQVKSILMQQKEWYIDIRTKFRSHPIPSYYLEEVLKRPYAEILSSQNDPEFIIEMTIPDEKFEKELLDNTENAKQVVFDYSSLLNLSKMNLLGHLPKFGKELAIAEKLFSKVQHELLMVEQEDLRRLWHFLCSSKEIELVEKGKAQLKDESIHDLFEQWIIDSIKLAKEKSAVFVTDDLRFLRFLRSQNIKGCNTPIILKFMRQKNWIDAKVYSTSIGDLAERCYTFLSFSGDDLFQIVMEDHCQVTLRTYHLVNQLLLPGSVAGSFFAVFVKFLDLLWKTGSLPRDKIQWLTLLTHKILELVEKQATGFYSKEFEKFGPSLLMMWGIAVQRCDKDEITLLEKKASEILDKIYLIAFRDTINNLIAIRKKKLFV